MPLENGKWRVSRGDCLWTIAKRVYNNGSRWKEIAGANGLPQRGNPIIYPNQLLTLPGVTEGSKPNPPTPPPPPPITKARIDWFSLTAGSERDMEVIWEYNSRYFWTKWEQWDANGHLWTITENKNEDYDGRQKASTESLRDTEGWNVCRFSVRPVDKDGKVLPNTDWAYIEYDFRNNPPSMPPDPTIEIDTQNNMIITFENIDTKINADLIEIAIYKDNIKFNSAKIPINKETLNAKYTTKLDYGGYYIVKARAVRGNIYGGWTNFTSPEVSFPLAPKEITSLEPKVISEQMAKQYSISIEWTPEKTAKQYIIQWTTNPEYFDTDNVSSKTTNEGDPPRTLIPNIEVGHTYYFRVGSSNERGQSKNWTEIKSVKIGTKPAPPTTWSDVTSAIMGEDLYLYWAHNSTDNSVETFARVHITLINSDRPQDEPMEYTKIVKNEKPEEHKNDNSYYKINTNDPEWSVIQDGYILKWKVQTTGLTGEYSEWSVEREVNIYTKPTLTLDITNKTGISIYEINEFPFNISILAKPYTQLPISYSIEVVANSGYETIGQNGERKVVNAGDTIYQKFYDPETKLWEFILVMEPKDIDLENDITYTVNATVGMDSGLTAKESKTFLAHFTDMAYDVYGNVYIDKKTLTATIYPYCNEYYADTSGQLVPKLSDNCTLAVYRREYDGSFTEIASDIDNMKQTYVTDPHPALDYARYRIVARTKDTGSISFANLPAVHIGEPSVVVQWGDDWASFDYDASGDGLVEPEWAGSMIKIPYNLSSNEIKKKDRTLVKYAGRKHPVSYFGTQENETNRITVQIPKTDKETIFQLRRLSSWDDNVYIREPNGTGYWAVVEVTFSMDYKSLVIPVTFNITRVEGGM